MSKKHNGDLQITLKKELETLQKRLAEVDIRTMSNRKRHSGFDEFMVLRLQDLKIKMYQEKGHRLPHIHIDYGKKHHVASFSIDPPRRLEGALAKKYDRVILSWIDANVVKLLEIWEQLQLGRDPRELVTALKGH